MKIRYGFVSNSSSSSFCIAKCYMTEKQMDEMRKFIDLFGFETNKYFCGTYSTEDVCSQYEETVCDTCEDQDCEECDKDAEYILDEFDTFLSQFGEDCESWSC